ncbi:MAG: GAF domain-containing protein [Oculatellaceae cyanobacterium bins.114]|nr:GAF domain-containing protein [Oculatellaceae cyanobacterium bins.114]
MTHPLRRSTSSTKGLSQDSSQDIAEPPDHTTAKAADYPDRSPNSVLDIQTLQILDSSEDCIKMLDLEGRILFMNRGGQELLGIQDITPLLNTFWVNFWQDEEQQAAMDAIAQAAAGEVCSLQGYCPTMNGEPKWWDNKISPILGADGRVERLLCISRDITDRKLAENERQQTEAALRASEAEFRLFTAASSNTVYKMSADWREMYLLEGKNFLATIQQPKQTWFEQYIPVEERTRVRAAIEQAIRTKSTFELEHQVIQLDGTIGWTFSRAIPLLNDRNEIVEWLGAASDVTVRKQAELSAEFLSNLTQNLVEATCVEDIIQIVGEQLNRYLHVSNCAFVEVNESADLATIAHSWHQTDVPSLVSSYRLSEFVTGEFFQTAKLGQTIIVRDVKTDSRIADPKRFAALKIGSFINVPLIRNDEWKFTLGIYHRTPYSWRSDEIYLMRELANRIWTKLERTRVESALRQNQEMFSALVSEAPFGVYMIDANFRFQQANQTAIAAFNIGSLIGRDLAEALRTIWQEPFATEAIHHFRHTLATGESFYSPPIVEPRADIAEIQSYDWQIHRITLSDGRYGVVCYFYDLSEIKRAEEIIRRNGDRDAFLVTLNDALRPLTDAIAIQATANRVLGEHLQTSRVTYFEVRGADYVVEQDYVNGVEPSRGSYPIESFGAELLATYRSGRTAISTDVTTDFRLSPDQRSAYAGVQIAAYIGVPLVKQGEFVAGLAVHSASPRKWTSEEIALVEEVAERTWAAVERARAEAARRQSEARLAADLAGMQRLYDLYAMLATGPDLKTALDEILAVACEFTHTERGCVQLVNDDSTRLEMFTWRGYSDDSPFINHFRYEGFKEGCDRARVGRQRFIIEETIGYPGLEGTEAGAVAAAEGIRATQSTPIMNRNGKAIGVLSTQFSQPHRPRDDELRLIDLLAWMADDFIERYWADTALRESEEKYRSLFESIDQGFCLFELLFDANGKPIDYRFLDVNQAFEQQCGLADAAGKTILELAPNFEPQWIDLYAQVAKSGEAIRFEADVPSLNGIFDIYAFPSGAPGQNRVAALFANITERKQTEAAIAADLRDTQLLRELSARLATEENIQALYQEIMAAAIALTHADAGTVQILDETTQDLLLLATQGFDRTMTDQFYRVNASSNTPCGIALRSNIRSFVDFDVPASEDPDGTMRMHVEVGLLSAQSTPLISRSGKPIGMVSTHWRTHYRSSDRELRFLDLLARQAADLIEQRQAEAQRKLLLEQEQAAREEAERANRIKDEFLAVLSHELRSPLNPILGWTRLLQNGKLDPVRQQEALVTIERNAKLQTQLIEDLLDISRIMRGKLSLTVTPVRLPYVISAAVETVRLAAEAKTIQITLDLAPDIALVSGDAARLQQVVWNLLTNAVKFTPNGGQVMVELRQLDSQGSLLGNRLAQIRVIDTGKGINPQFLPHVFEYFRQEDGSTTRKFGGLGLGLAIVRRIVQMHGGDVWAESQGEGQGATFIVQLPTMKQRAVVSEPSQPQSGVGLPLTGIQILLVDDEPDTREFQAFLLEQSGATVTAVASGLEALQALEQSIPDVVVSDIGMAEMDGYMLLQQIRSRPFEQGGRIPAIALTAYAAEIDQQRAIQVGFQRHLTKPVEPETLVKAVSTLLERT